jgi:hypothetical protein
VYFAYKFELWLVFATVSGGTVGFTPFIKILIIAKTTDC